MWVLRLDQMRTNALDHYSGPSTVHLSLPSLQISNLPIVLENAIHSSPHSNHCTSSN